MLGGVSTVQRMVPRKTLEEDMCMLEKSDRFYKRKHVYAKEG